MINYAVCVPKSLAPEKLVAAAAIAAEINPVNHPPLYRLAAIVPGFQVTRERIAVLTTKYWHTKGVKLTVGFLDDPPADLRARIISHMNACPQGGCLRSNGHDRVEGPRLSGKRAPRSALCKYQPADTGCHVRDRITERVSSATPPTRLGTELNSSAAKRRPQCTTQ